MEQWIKDIAAEITIDSLPESYQSIALIIGLEATLQLAEYLGGSRMYFYQLDTILRGKRDERIHKEFTGFNHLELARKYHLTETRVRDILRRPAYKQGSLFE